LPDGAGKTATWASPGEAMQRQRQRRRQIRMEKIMPQALAIHKRQGLG